MRTCTRNT
uniref:Uncharacterized protein n=1 Tax=Rhizophora mucronata TaxID=61149 RepID=A0A2P2P799_RHIMU